MTTKAHSLVSLAARHPVIKYSYASAAARTGATGFAATDLHTVAYQADTGTYWMLTATTPTWAQMVTAPAGIITVSAGITFTGGGTIGSTAGGNITIDPDGAGYNIFGAKAAVLDGGIYTNHVLDALTLGHDAVAKYSWIQSAGVAAGSELLINPNGGLVSIGTSVTQNLGSYSVPLTISGVAFPFVRLIAAGTPSNCGVIYDKGASGFISCLNNNAYFRFAPMASIDETGVTAAKDGIAGITIKTEGNVGIGTVDFDGTPPAAMLVVKSVTNDGSTNVQVWRDSDEVNVASLDSDGSLTTTGGRLHNVTPVNAATYDLLASDYFVHVTYTATGAVTSLTLPTAQTVSGRTIVIKDAGGNASANNITVDTQASETIDGAATAVMNADYEWLKLYSDGSDWFIVGN